MESTDLFQEHFAAVYQKRWPQLSQALAAPEKQVCRYNFFSVEARQRFAQMSPGNDNVHALNAVWSRSSDHPQRTSEELLDVYIMDPASIFAAKALHVQPGQRVLDMCAAPGGKSLVLAEDLFADADLEGELFCNDLSEDRRERLKKVIQQYVPRSVRDRIWVHGRDAVQYGLKEPASFDRILLDAPCSGERHLLENPKAMKEWSPRRTEHLAARQYSLLSAAMLALKTEGRLVYSTCSISPAENDEVIRKLLKKKKDKVRLLTDVDASPWMERTEFGWQFLPDQCGFGPIYFSVLTKTEDY